MKRNGFTLIELLAVIVVLAVIALISTPIIISVLERARKEAFRDSAYGIINASKLYYADASLDEGVTKETFTFPENTKLKITGEKPKSGSVILDEEGKVEIAISNGTWCATKRKDEEKVTITDYSVGDCEITGGSQDDVPSESCFVMGYVSYTDFDINYEKCMEAYNDEVMCSNQPDTTLEDLTLKEYLLMEEHFDAIKTFESKGAIENVQSVTDENALAKYRCTDTEVVVPSVINGKTVKRITYSAFSGKSNITSIVLPDTITEIGKNAFFQVGYRMYQTTGKTLDIIIPNSVRIIGDFAFLQCPIQNLTIGNNVEIIGKSAFAYNQLSSVTIPDSVVSIGSGAFAGSKLTDVKFGKSMTEIEEAVFSHNILVDVEIPSNIANIKARAFSTNKLETVKLSNGLISIGNNAFNFNKISNITIPSSVTSIGTNAFSDNNYAKISINKPENSISGSPWGASSVEWNG